MKQTRRRLAVLGHVMGPEFAERVELPWGHGFISKGMLRPNLRITLGLMIPILLLPEHAPVVVCVGGFDANKLQVFSNMLAAAHAD